MRTLKKKSTEITYDKFLLIALGMYPVFIIIGNLFINLFIFFFSLIFLINIKNNKKILKDYSFYILIFFFISLLINVLFSLDPVNSLPRVIKIFFVIFFIFQIKMVINQKQYFEIELIFKIWFIIFLVVLFDIFFEILFGHNTLGFVSDMPARVASFFGKELVVGAYLHGFVLFFLGYTVSKRYNSNLIILLIVGIVIISFLVGERSNFIKLLISTILFSTIVLNISYKKKIIFFLITIISILLTLTFNDDYKLRYYDQIKILFTEDGFSKYMSQSQYGAHQNTAIEIFKEYPLFGVGIKNFRSESRNDKYENKEYMLTKLRQATHPHQIHHEFLSETGIFGYLSFLTFIILSLWFAIKDYSKNKNIYQLAAIIFIGSNLIPYLPSGSFLSTFNSGFFWINYAVMISYIKNPKFKL